ncbi:lipopolysaccharide assembly protein LapB [Ramlibacter alkalitolerans]|uniref:Lipopolysaccharide assembly protein B n=1 Tax=Ramlibacter alkalitolerans TaxID=2039631 RepID=A0ABS1JND0_9BURK|nr:lipopolysaccharide assembly protein LapB [Ramlibacter alkalitolerans]MBL0425765.1 lipopolysaccharide assembly protein LapB [Ramlibacter alkalitolerans]
MDFDLTWLLWGLPVAFALGWFASRFDLRQLRIENRLAPKAYFRGLNFLLNEQQDQAIDAFIEAVQSDPDTSELHFALGNLFRRRGEYERAVRVHEHLLSRADLSRADRHRAQHALALDFLKAGLLDRAEEALRKLEGTAYEEQALLALLAIYERSRDWPQAFEIARKLDAAGSGQFAARQAHYLCEMAASAAPGPAQELLQKANKLAPSAPRPRIELAALLRRAGDARGAFDLLCELAEQVPSAMALLARPLTEAALACGRQAEAAQLLQAHYEHAPSLDVLEGITALETDPDAARGWYVRHVQREPSLVAAAKWIAGEKLEHEQFHPDVQRALDHAVKPLTRYRCAACGFESKQYFWQCPGCQAWDSYPPRRVEEL